MKDEEKKAAGQRPAGAGKPGGKAGKAKKKNRNNRKKQGGQPKRPPAPAPEKESREGKADKKAEPQKPDAEKTPKPLWMKLLLVFAAALTVLIVLAVLYINGKLDLIDYNDGTVDSIGTIGADEDQDMDTTGLEASSGEMVMPEGSPFADDDVLNILLISTDERTDAVNDWDAFTHLNELDGTKETTEFSSNARADSLILCSLNIREDTIKLVSIERATGVPIMLEGYEGQYDWITHTFRYGGARLTMDTVEDCFNVQVDHYVRFNFNSFVQIVDAVGGIDLDLTEDEAAALNWEVPSNSMLIVNKVSAGLNHFDGYTALQYARLRAIDDDWHRVARQRTVIQAVLDQIQDASVTQLNDLLDTVLPVVQTNFTKTEIAALMVQLPGFLGVTAEQMTLPAQGTYGVRTGMDDRSMMDPDWAANIRVLQNFLYNGMSADEAIASTAETARTAETAQEEAVVPVHEEDAEETYLKENTKSVYLDQDLRDADFGSAEYRVFLLGEDCTMARSVQAREALFQYLHEKQEVRIHLAFGTQEDTALLQRYLETGDEATLWLYMAALSGTERCTAAEVSYWRWLYDYGTENREVIQVAALGPEEESSAAMAETFADLLEEYPGEKFFAAVSLHEAAQSALADDGSDGFGALLNAADSPVSGEVCSILTIYTDYGSDGLLGDHTADDTYDLTTLAKAVGSRFAASEADLLLSLDGEDTPFRKENGILLPQTQEKEKPLLDYYQKLLVLFGSDTATPVIPGKLGALR